MTIDLALEYIPRRMSELGYKNYHLRFRHLVLQPMESIFISAFKNLFILVEQPNNVRVESDMGVFDLTETLTNELSYEHRNEISIENLSSAINYLRMIQVIPKNEEPCR